MEEDDLDICPFCKAQGDWYITTHSGSDGYGDFDVAVYYCTNCEGEWSD